MPTFLYQNEQQIGPFSDEELIKGLRENVFSLDDPAWREGLDEWKPLSQLLPSPPPTPEVIVPELTEHFSVRFGSLLRIDRMGFVGEGKARISPTSVTIKGQQRWHWAIRLVAFLIGLPFFVYVVFGYLPLIPVTEPLYRGLFSLFAFLLSPIATGIAIRFWCNSPKEIRLDRQSLINPKQKRRRIEFSAPDSDTQRIRKAVWTLPSRTEAARLGELLNSPQ